MRAQVTMEEVQADPELYVKIRKNERHTIVTDMRNTGEQIESETVKLQASCLRWS